MAAGVPCMTTPFVEQSGDCDAHFTWLKKISLGDQTLIDAMQQPIGGVQFFTNSDDAQTFLAWLVAGCSAGLRPRAEGLEPVDRSGGYAAVCAGLDAECAQHLRALHRRLVRPRQ